MPFRKLSFVLILMIPVAFALAGCASGGTYTNPTQTGLDTSHVPSGTSHGGLEDVYRLYNSGQFAEALDGANYLLKNTRVSGSFPLANYTQTYMIRYRANIALGNFLDARRDYEALSAFEWSEEGKVVAYYAILNALEGGDTSTEISRLQSIVATSDARATAQAQNASLRKGWDQLMLRAEANYLLGVIFVHRGDLAASRMHFQRALDDYQLLSTRLEAKMAAYNFDKTTDSYRRIIETYLTVLSDDADFRTELLEQLNADAFYQPKTSRGIYTNLNWDMPYDPFLVASSAKALKNWTFLASEGSEQNIEAMIDEGRYEDAYALLGKLYRSSRSDESVHRLANVMSFYAPAEMTEQARRYLAQANVHIQRRDYQQGVSAYLQVIEQSPWIVDAYYNLAQIYAAAEDYRNAMRTMEHFLILSPNSPRSREARDSIYTWEVSAR